MFFSFRRILIFQSRKDDQQGFTLVEALTSLLLLSIFSISGLAIYMNSGEIQTMAMHKKVATEMASSMLENYHRSGYYSLPALSTSWNCVDRTPWIAQYGQDRLWDLPGLSATACFRYPSGTTDYKEARVTIAWTEAGKMTPPRNVELTTYIAK